MSNTNREHNALCSDSFSINDKSSSDKLRKTDKFEISYVKESPLEIECLAKQYDTTMREYTERELVNDINKNGDDISVRYNPFHISQLQNFNPLYTRFFDLTEHNYHKITLNQPYGIRQTQVVHRETNTPCESAVFFKFAPLLDPIRYMIGKYDLTDPALKTLPTLHNQQLCNPKIADTNNVSYVDSFFCYLSSQLLSKHRVFNAIDFYGSYLGIQELFRVEITDDLDYLHSSPFYNQHLNRDFYVENYEYSNFNKGSKSNRKRICIQSQSQCSHISLGAEDVNVDQIVECDANPMTIMTSETVYEKPLTSQSKTSATSSTESSHNSNELNYSSDEDSDSNKDDADDNDDKEDDDDDDESSYKSDQDISEESESDDLYAYICDFPTQMICLEKCDGVLDDLLSDESFDEERIASCLFQIVMTLIVFQKAFHFTHNDLHTNNIVFTETNEKYVYYQYNSKYYRVPTHGRIFKIIDFGRAIYRFRDQVFCSDSFAKCGDAYSQYNCEPYLNPEKARIDPNTSFDLCRLGCSMYDIVFDETDEPHTMKKLNPLQETVLRWCTDDNGKNILYKKNGEERYPGFKLYKMIARNVHKHTPEAQLSFSYFSQFETTKKKLVKLGVSFAKDNGKHTSSVKYALNIDEIPSYTVIA